MSASEINSIIERAINLANEKSADAGLYANLAVRATDTIHYDEGRGQWNYNSGAGLITVTVPPMPQIGSPAAVYSAVAADIRAQLVSDFADFFSTYFPNDIAAHNRAVAQLDGMASKIEAASLQLFDRLGVNDGTEALQRLKDRVARADLTTDYLEGRFSLADASSRFMLSKQGSGNAAATYLVNRFASGDAAATALINMLTSGGTSLPPAVEDQVWERERARILKEVTRANRQTVDSMAARGFPLPPGAMNMSLLMTEADAQEKISQSSREVAIKQIDVLIENIRTAAGIAATDASAAGRSLLDDATGANKELISDAQAAARLTLEDAQFAARTLIEDSLATTKILLDAAQQAATRLTQIRNEAINASVDYIKALALGPQIGASVSSSVGSTAVGAAQAAASYFSAQASAASSFNSAYLGLQNIGVEVARGNADNTVKLHTAYGSTLVGIANAKANAALGAAQAAGYQGAAALSTLNAIASLTSSD